MSKHQDPYFLHLTLQTGHTRKSERSEVWPETVELLRPVLERALGGERVPLPRFPGYSITATKHRRCLLVTLWGQAGETARPEPVPILTVGVALHSRCGAYLWRTLHKDALTPLATAPEAVPPEPWVADRIELGAALHLPAMEWTGDFSRSVAWTWYAMRMRNEEGRKQREEQEGL